MHKVNSLVIIPELKEKFPDAPFISRPGQINAWDNEDFVKAVEATGKKQLIIAGIVTDVCVTFCALSALEAGYEVFVVTDASGTFDEACRYAAWDRMSRAGVQLVNWFSVVCELHRDWRNDIDSFRTCKAPPRASDIHPVFNQVTASTFNAADARKFKGHLGVNN